MKVIERMGNLQNSKVFKSGKVHLDDPGDVIPVQVPFKAEKYCKTLLPFNNCLINLFAYFNFYSYVFV